MNVLFVNPHIYDFTAYDLWLRPLGLLYLAAVVEKYTNATIFWLDALDRTAADPPVPGTADGRGHYPRQIVEKPPVYRTVPRRYARYGLPEQSLRRSLQSFPEMDLICITSLMTYWLDGLRFTLSLIRSRYPRVPVVVGGILPSLVDSDTLRRLLPVDRLVTGAGEVKILKIMSGFGARVAPHPDLADIGNLPPPAVDRLGDRKVLPLLTSRGCPLRCTYCASPLLNRSFQQRPPKNVLDEIRIHQRRYHTRDFVIFDDALLVNRERHLFPLLEAVIRDHPDLRFHTPNGLHTRMIDRRTARMLYSAGFTTLTLSFESTSDQTLHRSSDKVGKTEMEAAVRHLVAAGYPPGQIGCYLLFGAPWQNRRELENALDFTEALGIRPHLALYSPVPRTPEYRRLVDSGKLVSGNLYQTNKIYFLYRKSPFSQDDIRYFKNRTSRIRDRFRGQSQ